MRLGLTPDLPIAHEHATAWQGRYTEICHNILDTPRATNVTRLKRLSLEPDGNITIDGFETSLNKTSMKPAPNKRTRILAWIGLGWLGSS